MLAQISIVLDRLPRPMLAVYTAIIGLVMAVLMVGQASAMAREKGELYGGIFLAGMVTLIAVAACKWLGRRR
jgi:hypothetical protein